MLKRYLFFSFVFMFLIGNITSAEVTDGLFTGTAKWFKQMDELNHKYTTKDCDADSYLVGYLFGVVHATNYKLCLPKEISMDRVLDIVRVHLKNHPEQLSLDAPKVIIHAIQEKWPCKDSQ